MPRAGHITAADRDGRQRKFPLLTFSVAALDSETIGADQRRCRRAPARAREEVAKQQPGNSFVLRSDERVVDLLAAARRPQSEMLPMEQLMNSA